MRVWKEKGQLSLEKINFFYCLIKNIIRMLIKYGL